MSKILWLASYPKSGNTWLRLFLSAYHADRPAKINETGPFSYDDMSPYTWQMVAPKPLDECSHEEMAAMRGAYLAHLTNIGNGDRVFVKTHACRGELEEYPVIPLWCSEAAIYIVRDPRDVVCSYAHHCEDSYDRTIELLQHENQIINIKSRYHVIGSWTQNIRSWLTNEGRHGELKRLVLRYEDMLNKPHATFGTVVRFLGWDFDDARLHRAIISCSFDNLADQEKISGFRECSPTGVSFFRKGQPGGWRDELNHEQISRIEDAHGETMEVLGYGRYCDSARAPRSDRHPGSDGQDQRNDPLQKCG